MTDFLGLSRFFGRNAGASRALSFLSISTREGLIFSNYSTTLQNLCAKHRYYLQHSSSMGVLQKSYPLADRKECAQKNSFCRKMSDAHTFTACTIGKNSTC